MNTLNQWIRKFRSTEERNPQQRVLIADKFVTLTATQAIRFDQLAQLRIRGGPVSRRADS